MLMLLLLLLFLLPCYGSQRQTDFVTEVAAGASLMHAKQQNQLSTCNFPPATAATCNSQLTTCNVRDEALVQQRKCQWPRNVWHASWKFSKQQKSRRFYCPWRAERERDREKDGERTTTGRSPTTEAKWTKRKKKNNNNKAQLLLLPALLSFLAPSSTMLLGESFANSCYGCHRPPLLDYSCTPAFRCQCPLHFILLLSTLARAVNKATWLLTRFCFASLFLPFALFLDFYALLVPWPLHICFFAFFDDWPNWISTQFAVSSSGNDESSL